MNLYVLYEYMKYSLEAYTSYRGRRERARMVVGFTTVPITIIVVSSIPTHGDITRSSIM